jgi:hypothetical protein
MALAKVVGKGHRSGNRQRDRRRNTGEQHPAGLDQSLKEQGTEMIAPHRWNRMLKTQDGRRLRRYGRRWLVERYFALEAAAGRSFGVLRQQFPGIRGARRRHDAFKANLR